MYGSENPKSAVGQGPIVRPNINSTNADTITTLRECGESLDNLLAKLRGSQPSESLKMPEETPSVLGNASRLNILSMGIRKQLAELYQVIGD